MIYGKSRANGYNNKSEEGGLKMSMTIGFGVIMTIIFVLGINFGRMVERQHSEQRDQGENL